MAKLSKHRLLTLLEDTGMVPVFYHPDVDIAWSTLQACYNGGVRVFEFTNRGDFAHEVFGQLSKLVRQHLPDLALGAGTITDTATAALYLQLGADFIVSPCLLPEVATICNRRKVAYMPGCLTLTEINNAYELGADVAKVFPGSALGPAYIKSILGPFPYAQIMPTGGVEPTEESINSWFTAGVFCVGIGSQLFPKILDEGGLLEVARRCETATQAIQKYKHG